MGLIDGYIPPPPCPEGCYYYGDGRFVTVNGAEFFWRDGRFVNSDGTPFRAGDP
jgi:hypothetical protein